MNEIERVSVLDIAFEVMCRLEVRWLPDSLFASEGFFEYIPMPLAEFMYGMEEASKHTAGRRFLEIGCGIGTKLALMHYAGWSVQGIDINQDYLDSAAQLCPEAKLTCSDMRDVPYFDADVVYMYRPAFTLEMEQQLDHHLADNIAIGTLLYLVPETPDFWHLGLEKLGPYLWVR
jgi:trans-aconitate methyltransferase